MKKILNILIAVIFLSSCTNEVKEVISKYPDGLPKVVVYYKKVGEKKIKMREFGYYHSQKEMYEGKYKNELRFGIWTYLYENGKPFAKGDFITNTDVKKWEILDPTGNPFMNTDYKMKITGMYNNGAPYQVNFAKPSEKAVNQIFFYPDYKIQITGKSVEGLREETWIYYYENGNKWSEGYFKGDIRDGISNVWYENGQKHIEGFFKNGKETGVWKYYNQQGKLEKEADYDKGKADKLAKK